jgi:hypothetical protein
MSACAPHMSAFRSKADKYERWEVSPLHVGIVIGSDNAIVAPLYFDVARTRGSFDDPRGFRNRKPSQPHWHVCLAQETADAIAHVLAGVA